MKKRILALIPARYQSSRFPGKPLAIINGKPMIQRVYEQTAKAFEDLCVATDDQRIADAVAAFGGKAVMTARRDVWRLCINLRRRAGKNLML